MHTMQAKTTSPKPATRTAEPTQKSAHSAGAPTRLPAWTSLWGNHPPVSLQAKLTVNQPEDAYEQEAYRVAEQVMRKPTAVGQVQRRCACGGIAGPEGECEACKQKHLSLQRRATSPSSS